MIYVDVRLPFRNIENSNTNILICKYWVYTTNKQIFSFAANITHVSFPRVRSNRSVGHYLHEQHLQNNVYVFKFLCNNFRYNYNTIFNELVKLLVD